MDKGQVRADIKARGTQLYQQDVDEILQLLRASEPISEVARAYGVPAYLVNHIGWGHYGDPPVWTRNMVGRRVPA